MGPIPKRESERQRPRERQGGDVQPITKGTLLPVTIPSAPKGEDAWHPIAEALYESLMTSGQSAYFQNSDWHMLYTVCDDLSRYKRDEDMHDKAQALWLRWHELTSEEEKREAGFHPQWPPKVPKGGSAIKLASTYEVLGRLLVTEGDRRRLRLELEAAPNENVQDAGVVAIADYRKRLTGESQRPA